MPAVGQAVPPELAACVAVDASGTEHSFGSLWADSPVFVVFLRHFGCIGCAENISLLAPRFEEIVASGTRVVLLGCGSAPFIEGFRERMNLLYAPVDVLSDDSLASHKAAGLKYGYWHSYGPVGMSQILRAFVNGNVQHSIDNDDRQHAGAMVVDSDGLVRLYHRNKTIGDHVSGQAVVDVALALLAARSKEV